ncbi:S-adenosyl-L-methionine-dependent methyltransferase [Gymnopilus junonius]|uniref:rRNA adenine N(6)-methyltransferase n=1 Tax=Gymnopilus junonius TaxID=109634 RepID=A0A9P5NRY7_GYMJU|nr:S-adenosyl-L-methionine-dependent methyltransferase [Gymnopilus junonius]
MASAQFCAALRQSRRCARLELHSSLLSSQLSPQCRFTSTTAVPNTEPPAQSSESTVQEKEKTKITRRLTKPKRMTYGRVIEGMESGPLSKQSKVQLPHMDTWRKVFHMTKDVGKRVSLRNPDTAKMLAESFVPEGSRDKVVIEASPGPGQLTRALLDLPKERIKKLIVLEPVSQYLEYLKPLENIDERVKVLPLPGHSWSSYTKLLEMGLLSDVEKTDWSQVHPHLTFIMTMAPFVDGEQLAAQLLRTVPERQWLQQYGRVPMHFILTGRMWERMKAPPSSMPRCKVSVMAQAAAEMYEAIPYDFLQPYSDHFHPDRHNTYELKYGDLDLRRLGIPLTSASFIPLEHPKIETGDLDIWDYCVRKLFVQKATPLEKCITALGPGATNLLPKLDDPDKPEDKVDLKKTPRGLDMEEWSRVVRVFKSWPFRPEDLGIGTLFNPHQHNR